MKGDLRVCRQCRREFRQPNKWGPVPSFCGSSCLNREWRARHPERWREWLAKNYDRNLKQRAEYRKRRRGLIRKLAYRWWHSRTVAERRLIGEAAYRKKRLKLQSSPSLALQYRLKARRFAAAAVGKISNSYIASSMRLPVASVPPELLALKRSEIRFKRAVRDGHVGVVELKPAVRAYETKFNEKFPKRRTE